MNQTDCEVNVAGSLRGKTRVSNLRLISFCFIFDWLKKVARKKSLNLVFT